MLHAKNRMTAAELRRQLGLAPVQPAPVPGQARAIVPPWLQAVLDHPLKEINRPKLDIGPEGELSHQVLIMMRDELKAGQYRGIFGAISNESRHGSERLSRWQGQIKKWLGLVPGTTDWFFMWGTGAGVIELKAPGNREAALKPNQIIYRDWCRATGINWALENKLGGVRSTLLKWGAFRPRDSIRME